MPVELRPLHGEFGAEVIGANPALDIDDATFGAIQPAEYRDSMLFVICPQQPRFVYRHRWREGDPPTIAGPETA